MCPAQAVTSTETQQIADVMTIDDLETLRLLSDPLRLNVMQAFAHATGKPQTVKQIARELGAPPTKLYYHVNLLEERGLLRVAESRVVSGIIEKSYVPAARSFSVNAALFTLTPEGMEATARSIAAIFQSTATEIANGLESGRIVAGPDADASRKLTAAKTLVRMPVERHAELQARLHQLIDDFEAADDDGSPDDPTYALVIAHYPLAAAEPATEEER